MSNRTELIRDEAGQLVEREFVEKLLWWQERGLQQTASGYGNRLNTGYMIQYAGKLRRVYAVCHSNVAILYVLVKGQRKFIC